MIITVTRCAISPKWEDIVVKYYRYECGAMELSTRNCLNIKACDSADAFQKSNEKILWIWLAVASNANLIEYFYLILSFEVIRHKS